MFPSRRFEFKRGWCLNCKREHASGRGPRTALAGSTHNVAVPSLDAYSSCSGKLTSKPWHLETSFQNVSTFSGMRKASCYVCGLVETWLSLSVMIQLCYPQKAFFDAILFVYYMRTKDLRSRSETCLVEVSSASCFFAFLITASGIASGSFCFVFLCPHCEKRLKSGHILEVTKLLQCSPNDEARLARFVGDNFGSFPIDLASTRFQIPQRMDSIESLIPYTQTV